MTSSTTSSSGELGSGAFLILAAVAVIAVVFGAVMWRRKVAGDLGKNPVKNDTRFVKIEKGSAIDITRNHF